jgi:hypothetical protein
VVAGQRMRVARLHRDEVDVRVPHAALRLHAAGERGVVVARENAYGGEAPELPGVRPEKSADRAPIS